MFGRRLEMSSAICGSRGYSRLLPIKSRRMDNAPAMMVAGRLLLP